MRIGIFTNCYLPMVNGVVGAIGLLRRGFIEAGHQVYIFAPAYDDYRDTEPDVYRYPAVDLTKAVKYPVAIPIAPSINRKIRQLRLDILHAHHPFVLGPLALRVARRQGIPIVYTFHTQYDQYNHYIPLPKGLVRYLTKTQIHRFAQTVDRITTPAASARQFLSDYGVSQPVTVIPNPTDLSKFKSGDRAGIRARYRISNEKLLINIGRVAPEKNLELLLESFQLMIKKAGSGSLRLMIVGDGPKLEPLKALAGELGISGQVIFTGVVDPQRVPDYLNAADLFVMTSTSEVKPLAQLEALASGVPIVAVAAAGANDTIEPGRNGLLVAETAEAVATAVLDLVFEDQRMSAFSKAARETAQGYAYQAIAGQYLELFNATISDHQRNGGLYK